MNMEHCDNKSLEWICKFKFVGADSIVEMDWCGIITFLRSLKVCVSRW
jgi:hypothetical protein